jgi:hypothetical protein
MKFARALALGWARLYTAGLTDQLRQRRLAEIESDVWEFEHDPDRPRFAAAHLLLRLILGIQHDVSWRIEHRAPGLASEPIVLSGTPRHPIIVTSAFTCSLSLHVVAGAVVIWLAAFPFYRPAIFADLGAESAVAPAPEFSGTGNDQAASTGSGSAEPDAFMNTLLQHRYPLAVRDGELALPGADVLRTAIAQSRFVLLGETHGNPQTPEFWGAVCNAAAPLGFRTLAIEEGPRTAAQLETFAKHSGGLTQMRAFHTQAPDSIHISSTPAEFAMLQQCARAGGRDFRLWGLIEEGIFRTPPAKQTEARRREQAMKDLFAANYEKAAGTTSAPPKVLLKFGAFHVYRGLNPLGGFGIGHHIAELARAQGAQSLHIRMMPADSSPRSRYLQPMLDNLVPDAWTMFDLRPLRQEVNVSGTVVQPDLATMVTGYDVLVIVRGAGPR